MTSKQFSTTEAPRGIHPFLKRVRVCRHYVKNLNCTLGEECQFLHMFLEKEEAVQLEAEARKRISLQREYDAAVQYYLVQQYQVHPVDSLPNYEALDAALKTLEDGGEDAARLRETA